MGSYYGRGIILKHEDIREADRLITIYTWEQGKLTAVARGARKISSKLAGSLEPISNSNLAFVRGRRYDTVTASEVVEPFQILKGQLENVWIASSLAELVDVTTREHVRDTRTYGLLRSSFQLLNGSTVSARDRALIVWYFVWRQLSFLGYEPELYACLECSRRIGGEKVHFSFRGGVVCDRCTGKHQGSRRVSSGVIKLLRLISSRDRDTLSRIRISSALASELNELTSDYLNYTQERDLKLSRIFTRM